jgi:hypothetical protein
LTVFHGFPAICFCGYVREREREGLAYWELGQKRKKAFPCLLPLSETASLERERKREKLGSCMGVDKKFFFYFFFLFFFFNIYVSAESVIVNLAQSDKKERIKTCPVVPLLSHPFSLLLLFPVQCTVPPPSLYPS